MHQLDSGSPNPALWEEICVIADLKLCTSRGAVQSCRWSMGLVDVGARSLWLGLSGLSDKEKVEFLDAPIDPKAMFGTTVTAMCQQCDLRKKEVEAFEVCLPRKPAARSYNPNRPNFRPSGRGGHSDFQTSRPAPTQQPGNASPSVKARFRHWLASFQWQDGSPHCGGQVLEGNPLYSPPQIAFSEEDSDYCLGPRFPHSWHPGRRGL